MRNMLLFKCLQVHERPVRRRLSWLIADSNTAPPQPGRRARALSVVLSAAMLIWASALCAADDEAAFSMSIDEFRGLSTGEQKTLVASVFAHRLRRAANLHYEALQLIDLADYDEATNTVGQIQKRLNGSRLHGWVLGQSFRMDTIRGGPEVAKPELFVSSALNAKLGIVHSTAHIVSNKKAYGRIDTTPDQIDETNQYARWLDGALQTDYDSILRYAFRFRDEFAVEAAKGGDYVKLTVPWHFYGQSDDPAWGVRVFWLDPRKGFFPVHGKSRGRKEIGGRKLWRLDEFFVEESRLVGDTWMPTKLKWVVACPPLEKSCNVYHVTVERLDAGSVNEADLQVHFEPGMTVIDAIKGESFVVGRGGERTEVQPLGSTPVAAPPTSRWRIRHLWIVVGNLFVLGGALLVRRIMTRKSSGSHTA